MRAEALGCMDKKDQLPGRGERVASYIENYLRAHPGLSQGELAFRLRADKRDLRRLLAEKTIGHRLEESIAAFFGDDFIEHVWRPVVGDGPSRRERELERERAEIAARRERLERDRAEVRKFRSAPTDLLRMVDDENWAADL